MMSCRQCQGLEALFDAKTATKELEEYRRKGPKKTTRMLIDALRAEGVHGATLLDIGGGVGAVQHELLRAGVSQATSVDASSAYIEVAQREATRQGNANRVGYYHGDFVDLSPEIELVDIVTLDRTICCYHDMPALVGLSSSKARKLYGLVFPRDTWWIKLGGAVINLGTWLCRKPYRFFVHSSREVEEILGQNGFEQCFKRKTLLWQTVIYSR